MVEKELHTERKILLHQIYFKKRSFKKLTHYDELDDLVPFSLQLYQK